MNITSLSSPSSSSSPQTQSLDTIIGSNTTTSISKHGVYTCKSTQNFTIPLNTQLQWKCVEQGTADTGKFVGLIVSDGGTQTQGKCWCSEVQIAKWYRKAPRLTVSDLPVWYMSNSIKISTNTETAMLSIRKASSTTISIQLDAHLSSLVTLFLRLCYLVENSLGCLQKHYCGKAWTMLDWVELNPLVLFPILTIAVLQLDWIHNCLATETIICELQHFLLGQLWINGCALAIWGAIKHRVQCSQLKHRHAICRKAEWCINHHEMLWFWFWLVALLKWNTTIRHKSFRKSSVRVSSPQQRQENVGLIFLSIFNWHHSFSHLNAWGSN